VTSLKTVLEHENKGKIDKMATINNETIVKCAVLTPILVAFGFQEPGQECPTGNNIIIILLCF